MPSFQQNIYKLIYKPFLSMYLKRDVSVRFDGFKLKVFKGVFHPKLFFSTSYFYDFIKKQELKNKRFLEIGCGSGILSLLALKKEALVTAIDIDEKAVENTQLNFSKNFISLNNVKIIQSDLFANLHKQAFDVIIINPPYYFKKVETASQYAWYCGEHGEYFEKLFLSIHHHIHIDTLAFIILEENCEIDRIKAIAAKYNIEFMLLEERLIKWEINYIFKIKLVGINAK